MPRKHINSKTKVIQNSKNEGPRWWGQIGVSYFEVRQLHLLDTLAVAVVVAVVAGSVAASEEDLLNVSTLPNVLDAH